MDQLSSDLAYDDEDADKPLLVKEARHIVEDRLRVGRTFFFEHVRPLLDKKPILPGGRVKRIRKGDVETLCNILLQVGPQKAKEYVQNNDIL
jgi:hypothetical protein